MCAAAIISRSAHIAAGPGVVLLRVGVVVWCVHARSYGSTIYAVSTLSRVLATGCGSDIHVVSADTVWIASAGM